MYKPVSRLRFGSGFSLVELMVGIAIGLLGVLIIMQVSTVFEGQKRTTTTGSDAQTAGSLAFYSLERDVRRAGYGFSVPGILGCTINLFRDGSVQSMVLQPVSIRKGAGDAPDEIQMLSSAKNNWSVPIRMTTDHSQTADEANVNSTLGVQMDDLLIAYEPGKDCAMLRVTGPVTGTNKAVSNPSKIEHKAATTNEPGIWNPADMSEILPDGGYANNTLLFNLGSMMDKTYSIQNNTLQVQDMGGIRSVAADVVSLKAQYGIINVNQIDWGDNLPPSDIGKLVAVRLAIVARSPLKEKADSSGNCSATTIENEPKWAGGNLFSSEQSSYKSANPDWQCYRYRTFENVIPLRNMMWKENDAS